ESSSAAARLAGGLRADYGFVTTMDREIIRDPEREVGYGITDSWDEIVEALQGAPVSTDTELGGYMREFKMRVRQDTEEIYMRRQIVISELLRADHRRSTKIIGLRTTIQGQVIALQGQVIALQAQVTAYRDSRDSLEVLHSQSYQRRLLQAMIDQGVTATLAARDALRSTNGDDSHNSGTGAMINDGVNAALAARDATRNGNDSHTSGTGARRPVQAARECSYSEFVKCKPLDFKDISSPFEELSDIGSPRADDHEHFELPDMLEDPYVEVDLQATPSPDYIPGPEEPEQAPPSPDYVPGPEHADDEIVVEDQPYAEDASPNAQSPEYVLEFDLEAHLEDDDDEDPKEDPIDYPADGGDDDDDEEGSSEDDEDDDMDIKADEEEEEHPAPADSVVVASTAADQAPSAKETEPFETDESAATPPPHPAYRMTARISIPAPVPMPAWSDSEVVRLLAIPEVTLPPPKKLGIALGPRYEVGESSSAAAARPAGEVGYGITDSWDEIVETLQGAPVRTDLELDGYMREFETRVRQNTDEIYMRLMTSRASDLVRGEVMLLRTTVLGQMTEIRELHAANRRRQTVISELLRTDHRRSTGIIELRTALQGQVTALQKQMAPKRTTRSAADQETINATSVTNAQLQAMIDQGVTAALAARDALRSMNGDDSHNFRTSVRRIERATRECTYVDFLKCQPVPFKGTEGVASLS
nr:hypothetical protein [Tanacetum cinerariifolium]